MEINIIDTPRGLQVAGELIDSLGQQLTLKRVDAGGDVDGVRPGLCHGAGHVVRRQATGDDHARRKRRLKRQAPGDRILLDELIDAAQARSDDLVAIDEALERLAAVDADMARLVDLRFFAGLSVAESAAVLGMSPRQAAREWVTGAPRASARSTRRRGSGRFMTSG